MPRPLSYLALLGVIACVPKTDDRVSEGADVTTQVSSSSEAESTTGGESGIGSESESESETGEEIPPDACPASPVLESLKGIFDGIENGYDYPEADWVETCTVSAHTGDLVMGETITLACVTGEGQAVEHVLEVQASLVDAEQPTTIQVEVGETLQLSLWSHVWFSGGASWMLRDAEQPDDIRLIYYSTLELLEDDGFSPTPEFVAPLVLTLHDDVCETICPEPDERPGSFVPFDDCVCEREQAIEFALGPDSVKIQHDSAGPVGTSMFAFVNTAAAYPDAPESQCTDIPSRWYEFVVVALD